MQYLDQLQRCRFAIIATLFLGPGMAVAHIKNEASQFPDIEYSGARFDIVVLVGAGVIPETPVFEPDKPLSKRELASWAALAHGLAEGGETPNIDILAAAAQKEGVVESLEGNATFGDVNDVFFSGQLTLDNALETPTKAEAASFIAQHLNNEVGGALLARRGISPGATGEITAVTVSQGHHGHNAYAITIGGVTREMYEHGRVANGPTDLLQWQGRKIRRSFISGEGDESVWIYIEAEPLQKVSAPASAGAANAQQAPQTPKTDNKILFWLIGGVVVLGPLIFMSRRRS